MHRNTNSWCNIFKLYGTYLRKMGALVAAVLGSSQWSCLETLFLGMFLLASFWHEPQRGFWSQTLMQWFSDPFKNRQEIPNSFGYLKMFTYRIHICYEKIWISSIKAKLSKHISISSILCWYEPSNLLMFRYNKYFIVLKPFSVSILMSNRQQDFFKSMVEKS